jgi:hypothetical protein
MLRLRLLPKRAKNKIIGRIFGVSFVWIAVLFAYGMVRWFYGPIRFIDGKYLDKKGNEFSEALYLHFKAWEATLWISFLTMAVLVVLSHWVLGVSLRPGKK